MLTPFGCLICCEPLTPPLATPLQRQRHSVLSQPPQSLLLSLQSYHFLLFLAQCSDSPHFMLDDKTVSDPSPPTSHVSTCTSQSTIAVLAGDRLWRQSYPRTPSNRLACCCGGWLNSCGPSILLYQSTSISLLVTKASQATRTRPGQRSEPVQRPFTWSWGLLFVLFVLMDFSQTRAFVVRLTPLLVCSLKLPLVNNVE